MSFCSRTTLKLALAMALVVSFVIGHEAVAYEQTLAGLRLGRPAVTVLQKYGNPSRVAVGTVAIAATVPQAPGAAGPQATYNPYNPYGVGGPGGARVGGPEGMPFNPFAGEYTPPPAGALPQLPGIGGPPGQMLPQPGAADAGQQTTTITQQEVTWTYELSNGNTLEVIVAEGGLITQITAGGASTWIPSRTALGIVLGSTYKDVLYRYGYPEAHTQAGRFLRVSYVDKHRCMFTLLNNKVVGITIALAE